MPKGQENVDRVLDICREITEVIDGMSSSESADLGTSKEEINSMIGGLQEISGKFFLKSNPSIPPTSALLKSAEGLKATLEETKGEKDHTKFLEAMESFKKAFESLGKKASMRSTVIT